jgi:hypothetical protein
MKQSSSILIGTFQIILRHWYIMGIINYVLMISIVSFLELFLFNKKSTESFR